MADASSLGVDLALAYYRAIDGEGKESLEDLLTADFVQERSDRTFECRDEFVRFMSEERPDPNTTHEVRACFRATNEDGRADGDAERVAVQGRVRRSDGTPWFDFVDVFTVAEGRIRRLETYSR